MKKIILTAIAAMFVLGLSACQQRSGNDQMGNGSDQSATQSQTSGQDSMHDSSKKNDQSGGMSGTTTNGSN